MRIKKSICKGNENKGKNTMIKKSPSEKIRKILVNAFVSFVANGSINFIFVWEKEAVEIESSNKK